MPLARRLSAALALLSAGVLSAGVLGTGLLAGPAQAEAVPEYFGSDWHDPITADPPAARPDTPSCTVRIVDHEFRDYSVYTHDYAPPADCAGDWSKVVLTLHGTVAGRQYDRLGWLRLGGVPIFKTSTPEPSVDGIGWTVEKDVTEYAALLRSPGVVEMYLGNTVNDTYTGVLDITVDLTFYGTSATWPAAHGPETVQPLAAASTGDGATSGTLTVPANTERLVAEVYATGSGGGCEEFWYTAEPAGGPDGDYSCQAPQGPWREVQVHVDGRLAGIATPYPHVYTGGWSNPFLWYVLPAPRAFDIRPLELDLTPFVGTLTDGRPHTVSVSVDGAVGVGWDVPVGFLSWQDEASQRVTGSVTSVKETGPAVSNTTGTDGDHFTADLDGTHALTVSGFVRTSHGKVSTTVARNVGETAHHRWTDGEWEDGERLAYTDDGFVRTQAGTATPVFDRWSYDYRLDGLISVTDVGEITTTMSLGDTGTERRQAGARHTTTHAWDHGYDGEATWNYTVPREERRATGWSEQDFTDRWADGCWHRLIHTVNGAVTRDETGC